MLRNSGNKLPSKVTSLPIRILTFIFFNASSRFLLRLLGNGSRMKKRDVVLPKRKTRNIHHRNIPPARYVILSHIVCQAVVWMMAVDPGTYMYCISVSVSACALHRISLTRALTGLTIFLTLSLS